MTTKRGTALNAFLVLVCLGTPLGAWLWFDSSIRNWFGTLQERGLYGDQFGALNTLFSGLACSGIVFTLYLTYRQLHLQHRDFEDRLNKEAEARRTHTPRRTCAWTDETNLIVQNSGDEPVFDLVAYVGPMGTDFNDPEHAGQFLELVIGTVGPGAQIKEDLKVFLEEAPCVRFSNLPEVAVEFTDCNGSRWRRESRGPLKSIKSRRPYD